MSGVPVNPDQTSDKTNKIQVAMAVGTYTGTGAATLAITGLGFRPAFVMVLRRGTNVQRGGYFFSSVDSMTNVFTTADGGSLRWADDFIVSFDKDGFTIGDSSGFPWGNVSNVTDDVYTWIAWG